MFVNNVLKKYAKKNITPLNLKAMYQFNRETSKEKIINQSKFVYDEMLIRFLTIKVKKHDLETNYFAKKEFEKKVD